MDSNMRIEKFENFLTSSLEKLRLVREKQINIKNEKSIF
jgi:hypothetical protein